MLKSRLFTPGPTPVPEETLLELAKPVTYHRTSEQKAILGEVLEDLKYVFQTKNDMIVLTSSGTGGMEAAVSNTLTAGKKAILLTAGRWGERWRRGVMKGFGINIVSVEASYGKAVQPAQLEAALKEHPDAVAVFSTLSETSTGVGHDIAAFGKLVAKTPALLVVDGISGLGAMECRTDDWNIDICVSGSQKALMLPPGLAYVSVSAKAWNVIEANTAKNFYFDLRRYRAKLPENDTPFTPANTLIKAQRVSLKRIRAEGIENLWARHARMGEAARAGVAALGLKNFAEQPNNALTVVVVPDGIDGNDLLKNLEKKYGFKLANGQDNLKGKIFRISHMGYCDGFDVLGSISALELALLDAGFKLEPGAGVAAAQKVLAAKR